jgi:hypothetical protein
MMPRRWPESCLARRAMRRSLLLLFVTVTAAACSSSSADDSSASPSDGAPASEPAAKPDGESKASEEKPKDPSTSIVLGIDAEPFGNQGYNLSSLVAKVKVDGLVAAEKTYLAKDGPLFPREIRVDAPATKLDANVEIEVLGIMGESEVVKRWVRTAFDPGHSKLVHVFLQTRCVTFALLGGFSEPAPTCTAEQTCSAGKCIAPDVAPSALPDYYADWQKSPPDACGNGTASAIDVSVAEGGTVTLERGGQCGHHFYVDLTGMKDLSQWKTITSLSAVMPNTSITIPETSVPYTWSSSGSGTCELGHVRFQVDTPGHQVEEYLGQDMDLTVTAKDDRGRTASILRHVKVASTFLNPTGRPCN